MELRKDISKFITQICEKNYSQANSTLETLIEKKLKGRVKKMHKDCCDACAKKKKKKVVKENLDEMPLDVESEQEISNDPQHPESGDIILSPSGQLGSRTSVSEVDGKHLGTFASDEKALQFVKNHMEETKYFPNVWRMSDHGNPELLTDLNF